MSDVETWVCATCGHTVPKTSPFGFVGWMSDIARHTREHEEVQP
ncbi:hypothetical protein SEA_BEARBQ_86 [Gordonia phage BearBQ]|nr:hypothetical protein SEA_BEARBQ_86 [Gordonia phage BearBQ]